MTGAPIAAPVRTIAYVDGFNLYHAIDDRGEKHLLWVNLFELCREVLGPDDQLIEVVYCTAYASWRPTSLKRHRDFVKAQPPQVKTVLGKFKERQKTCKACGAIYTAHEEKETDVNLAVKMLSDAHAGRCDQILLVSADSDLAPPLRELRARFSNVRIRILSPIGRHKFDALRNAAGLQATKRMKRAHLVRSLLPGIVHRSDGSSVTRPSAYDPPV